MVVICNCYFVDGSLRVFKNLEFQVDVVFFDCCFDGVGVEEEVIVIYVQCIYIMIILVEVQVCFEQFLVIDVVMFNIQDFC